ncbi:MAG: type II toxin-antitoxin system VapB family antitoxin [Hyphomicrobiaceae bacterium]|nr:type II toxin-antitoxin system VapB family antitoxin [Hyphomicrobiaceae bacterium]
MGVNVTVEIDAELLVRAQRLTGDTSSTHVVEQALSEMIRRRSKIAALLDLAGSDPFYEGYDYKALRAGGNDHS